MLFVPRPKGLGKDAFLKLADKEEVTGVFRGAIHSYRQHWGSGGSVECAGEGCAFCLAPAPDGEKKKSPAFRFRVNFITTKDGKWVSRIFENGGELYDLLSSLDKKFDLSKTVVDLTRNGTGKDTRYTVLPRLDQPISKELKAKIDAVELLPLSADVTAPATT